MRVRRARPEDYDVVGALTLAAYEPFLLGEDDFYRIKLADAATRDVEAELWVATYGDSDEVVGGVTLCPAGSVWRELAADDEGEFRMLAVSPTAAGRGVGAALVKLAIAYFRERGARRIVLSSLDSMDVAHRLYARLGFTRAPERDWRPLPEVSLIAYKLEI